MRQLAEVLDRAMLKDCGIQNVELIDEIIEDMERISMLEIAQTGPKLKVNMKFISGHMAGQLIEIDPNITLTVFGSKKPNA